jgi:hypothetical protein
MWNKPQEGYQSISMLYAQEPYSIDMIRGYNAKNSGILKVKEYLKYNQSGMKPKLKFFRGMVPTVLMEMVGYEWARIKPHLHQNPREEAQNKDDHTMDALRYLIYFVYENGNKVNVFAKKKKKEDYSFLGWQGDLTGLPIHDKGKVTNVFDDSSPRPHTIERDVDFERRVGSDWGSSWLKD